MKLLSRLSLFTVKSQFQAVCVENDSVSIKLYISCCLLESELSSFTGLSCFMISISKQSVLLAHGTIRMQNTATVKQTFFTEKAAVLKHREGKMIPVFYQSFSSTDVSLLTLIPCNSIVRLTVLFIFFLIMLIFYF